MAYDRDLSRFLFSGGIGNFLVNQGPWQIANRTYPGKHPEPTRLTL
jgi:hypothetical protein